uniref:Uncharacterized protein n=1 Tax=Meloidogyne enterolobii TaxID=390850 RepID=A0A6V7VKP2_MELEN|nr:unnamed protein product [Meloidogyne enterolobii]
MLSNKISSDEFTSSSNSSENKHQTSNISNKKLIESNDKNRQSIFQIQPLKEVFTDKIGYLFNHGKSKNVKKEDKKEILTNKNSNNELNEEIKNNEDIKNNKEEKEGEILQPSSSSTIEKPLESKPKRRLRRRGSVVQPLNNDSVEITKNIDINTISNSFLVRPHSLSARHIQKPLEQSQPNEWIYIQLPDRTFKRTTEKDLQNCQQTLGKPTDNFDIKNYLSELSSVIFAKKLHSLFHSISTISQGFLAGIAFSHAIFIFLFLPELKGHENLVNIYSQMAVPIQAFFYICLSIAVVDALDGFSPFPQNNFWGFLSFNFIGIICWFCSFFVSLLCAQLDEEFAKNGVIQNNLNNNYFFLPSSTSIIIWKYLSIVRTIFIFIGWILTFCRKPNNYITNELNKILLQEGKMAAINKQNLDEIILKK